jgi:hypothetical protein
MINGRASARPSHLPDKRVIQAGLRACSEKRKGIVPC